MMQWFQALMPKEDRFFDLFERHAETLLSGAKALRELLDGGEAVPSGCRSVMQFEHEADDITREVLLAVRRSFITPFDRSDIKELTTSLDDAIDQMQKTAKAINLFEVTEFDPIMREMGDIIVRAAELTLEAVPLLRSLSQNASRINVLAEEVTQIEEQSDQLYDQGLKALFKAHRQNDPMGYIIGAEIYDHLEKVVDRFEDVANRMSGILIEHL